MLPSKVVVITHKMESRVGVRYLTNGLKVYHVPTFHVYGEATVPTIFSFFPVFRSVFLREDVDVVHGHQACSAFCIEAILHARTMGIKACFTDHSLFEFGDTGSIFINKVLKFGLSDVNHVICVSHTSRESTALRAELDPRKVSVIPNAVVADKFTPVRRRREAKRITVVALSRLVRRKGLDLLLAVIPAVCKRHPLVDFIIAGEGPMRVAAEQLREKYELHDRVRLLGNIPHDEVNSVLTKGQVFLNCSLTEAFCIGIVEATSCGLLAVATAVGGVPEVLPPGMAILAKPNVADITEKLELAFDMVFSGKVHPEALHAATRAMYSWTDVAERTLRVYYQTLQEPEPPLICKLLKYKAHSGKYAGYLAMGIMVLEYLLWIMLEFFSPIEGVDRALDTVAYVTDFQGGFKT